MNAATFPRTRALQAALEGFLRRAVDAARVPCGWISFCDASGEHVQASAGAPFASLTPAQSFAAAVAPEARFVEDARLGDWREHPLVAGPPHARFVAVLPFGWRGGRRGAITLVDTATRVMGPSARTALLNLASLVVARLEAEETGAFRPLGSSQVPDADALGQRLEAEIRRRRTAEESLAAERGFSRALLEGLGGAAFIVSPEGLVMRWNAAFASALDRTEAEIAGAHLLDFISRADRPVVLEALRPVLDEGRDMAIEVEVLDRAGNVRPYLLAARAIDLGGRRHAVGTARDITLRRRNEQHMARAKERLDLALTGSSLALWDWDFASARVYFNENWSVLRGEAPRESTFGADEVLGWGPAADRDLLRAAVGNAAKGVSEELDCESRVTDSGGEWMWVHWRGRVTQRAATGQALRMTGTCTNISKRKAAEERAEWLATRDGLTGLPNRVLLHDRLEQAIVNAARNATGFAFMFIDLDRFKHVNDSMGHQAGDALLKGVAARLLVCVRASDTVARLGGDKFAVIVENLRDDDDEGARAVATKMVASMATALLVEGQPITTSCSIGISVYPGDGRDGATLMKNADVAMYYAKEKGRNNFQFFSSEMNARAQERLSVENYLRLALKRQELVLHYQPRMRVADGTLAGVEALIRWQHPRRGLLGPDKFIDVAEDTGLIVAIGEWVLEAACVQLSAWQRRLPELKLSLNLSVGQVGDGQRLHDAVARALASGGIAPETLELELTESHLMRNIEEKAGLLNRLGDLGVGLAIDDFGTGYSSLSYLKRLPVDAIKIDSSFVRDLQDDPNDEAIVRAILAMAHSLKLSVVAEGVETAAQLESLRALGCDEYQGFLESPALPAADFEARYLR